MTNKVASQAPLNVRLQQQVLNSFLSLGGRGYSQELWIDHKTNSIVNVRTFSESYPINSTRSTLYDTQHLASFGRSFPQFSRYKYVCGKFTGFLRPPYSGMFRMLITADDVGEFWLSFNRSAIGMVSYILIFFWWCCMKLLIYKGTWPRFLKKYCVSFSHERNKKHVLLLWNGSI